MLRGFLVKPVKSQYITVPNRKITLMFCWLIKVKPVDQSLESLNSEVIYYLLFAVSSMLKCISVSWPIS